MRCEQCKGFIVKNSKFCQKCGSPQTEKIVKKIAKKIDNTIHTIKTVPAPVEPPDESATLQEPKPLYEGQEEGDVDEVPVIEEPEEPEEEIEQDEDTLILKRIDALEKSMASLKEMGNKTDQELGWVIQNLINIGKPYQKKADKPGGVL